MSDLPDSVMRQEGRHWPFIRTKYQWRTYPIRGKSQLWRYVTAGKWQNVTIREIGLVLFFALGGTSER